MREDLFKRANGVCELCSSSKELELFLVEPANSTDPNHKAVLCSMCRDQVSGKNMLDPNHWRCLNSSIWSEVPAVQVLVWRVLHRLNEVDWVNDLRDQLYLSEQVLKWAKAGNENREEEVLVHQDSNGAVLENGDTVVLIKDLDVRGAGFTAKRGTAIRNIRLVHDNSEHIEGKINGQGIIILTRFVKK
jgi:protein PhnA